MYFGVRNKCLQLLGCLGLVDSPLSKDGEDLILSVGFCLRSALSDDPCIMENPLLSAPHTLSYLNSQHEATPPADL